VHIAIAIIFVVTFTPLFVHPASALDSARFVICPRASPNPNFYGQLRAMGFTQESLPDFSQMAAINPSLIGTHGAYALNFAKAGDPKLFTFS
jgi:hypothetical protein